jgi:hypothetical protein
MGKAPWCASSEYDITNRDLQRGPPIRLIRTIVIGRRPQLVRAPPNSNPASPTIETRRLSIENPLSRVAHPIDASAPLVNDTDRIPGESDGDNNLGYLPCHLARRRDDR